MRANFEAVAEPKLVLDTDEALEACVERALGYLGPAGIGRIAANQRE